MDSDILLTGRSGRPDLAVVESALGILHKACDRAIDELGCAVPATQQRALLIVDEAGGSLDLRQLAAELTASVSATSRLADRMATAGLLITEWASGSGSRTMLRATNSGRRLACWIRDRQRVALSGILDSMRLQARDALVRALKEVAAADQRIP